METPKQWARSVQVNKSKHDNGVNDVVLMPLLLTSNRLHILFKCFYRWLWTSKHRLELLHTQRPCSVILPFSIEIFKIGFRNMHVYLKFIRKPTTAEWQYQSVSFVYIQTNCDVKIHISNPKHKWCCLLNKRTLTSKET